MRIYPAVHYTMEAPGSRIDYDLMSNIRAGALCRGRGQLSRTRACEPAGGEVLALMQGPMADGYFILPCTLPNYLATTKLEKVDSSHSTFQQAEAEVQARIDGLLATKGRRTVDSIHRELGKLLWDDCGMARSEASLRHALGKIPELQQEFRTNLRVPGSGRELNQSLEKAGRLADFLELAELMCDRCARAKRVVRRALSRGEPNSGRRGPARRREFLLRRGVGVDRRRQCARLSQGAAGF